MSRGRHYVTLRQTTLCNKQEPGSVLAMPVTLYVGPMFARKTTALLRALAAARAQGPVLLIVPAFDTRHAGRVVTHDGLSSDDLGLSVLRLQPTDPIPRDARYATVGVDELQFAPPSWVEQLWTLHLYGTSLCLAGLDLDAEGNAFGVVPVFQYDRRVHVERVAGTCGTCGAPSTHTLRFPDGRRSRPTVELGGSDRYAPRCQACWTRERALARSAT
jgi:thymidine kinase